MHSEEICCNWIYFYGCFHKFGNILHFIYLPIYFAKQNRVKYNNRYIRLPICSQPQLSDNIAISYNLKYVLGQVHSGTRVTLKTETKHETQG